MFVKKSIAAIGLLLLSVVLALTGCTDAKSTSSERVEKALAKSGEMTSYGLSGSVSFSDLKLPDDAAQSSEAAGVVAMLNNAELSWTGAYRADPMLLELNLKIAVGGDLAMSFQLPLIVNKEKLWIKIPNIPMLGLPDTVVGKYVEVDLKALAEQQGTEWPAAADNAQATKLVGDLSGIVFKHIDEKTYLTTVKPKDAGLSDDLKLKDVVQAHLTKDQVEPLVNTIVKDVAPEIIELLAGNEDYRKLLDVKPEDLDEAKKQLADTGDQEIKDALAAFNEEVKSMDVLANIGIDDAGYASYFDVTMKGEVTEDGQTLGGTIKTVSQLTNINGEQQFTGEPKAEDIIPEDQLSGLLGGLLGDTSIDLSASGL